jgi:acetylornithine deacetylase/succinyl-diaminopimelate desuccinylase-like protein
MQDDVLEQVDRYRIVELATDLANIVSITGDEENVAKYLGSEFQKLGMDVEYQYVEDGRPNVIGRLKGSGGGATLMFNAHMDHFDAPQETVVDDDRIYGRGLVNMKAAFPSNHRRRRRRDRESADRQIPRQRVSRRGSRRALFDGSRRDG